MRECIYGETKKEKIIKCIEILFIIYITDSLLFATIDSSLLTNFKRYIIILIAICMIFNHSFIKRKMISITPLVLSASILVTCVLSNVIFNGYYYYTIMAMIWIAYLFSFRCTLEEFSNIYCILLRVISIFSMVCWIFRNAIISATIFPEIINTLGHHFKFLFLTNVPTISHLAQRNYGPFWEPGTFQIYLFIALYFCLFIEKNNRKVVDSIIFVLAMLTTFSGAALIPILLIFAAYAFQERRMKTFFFVCVVIVILFFVLQFGVFDQMLSKITNTGESNSMTFRIIGIVGGLKAFVRHPLFGSSPTLNNEIKITLANQLLGSNYASNANTFMNYLGYFGIFVGGYFWYRAYKLFQDNMTSVIARVLCFIAFIISTSNENLTASLFLIVLLFLRPRKQLHIAEGVIV